MAKQKTTATTVSNTAYSARMLPVSLVRHLGAIARRPIDPVFMGALSGSISRQLLGICAWVFQGPARLLVVDRTCPFCEPVCHSPERHFECAGFQELKVHSGVHNECDNFLLGVGTYSE